jgi:hypothetical protein
VVSSYVDGGIALEAAPYDREGWRTLQEGWWWHLAAMVAFPPYAIVALVVWQRPGGQPLGRRVAWAVLAVIGAVLLVGIGAFVVFSRRWYWWHRTRALPTQIAGSRHRAGSGSARAAELGGELVDRLTGAGRRLPRHDVALPLIGAPWGPLRDQVAGAAARVDALARRADGPEAAVVARASLEATAAVQTPRHTAGRAAHAEAAQGAIDRAVLVTDLAEIDARRGDPADLAAARLALREQLVVVDRVAATLARTEGQLRRLAAQSGEVAARAEELVWSPIEALAPDTRGLELVTDELVAIRRALELVEQLDPARGAA